MMVEHVDIVIGTPDEKKRNISYVSRKERISPSTGMLDIIASTPSLKYPIAYATVRNAHNTAREIIIVFFHNLKPPFICSKYYYNKYSEYIQARPKGRYLLNKMIL